MKTNTQLEIEDDNHISLQGVVERITFQNPQNGFCVLKVKLPSQKIVPVIGIALSVAVGENIQAQGEWIQDQKYGKQFRASKILSLPPSTISEMEKYLASGAVKGVGNHYAKLLIKSFGEKVFEVLDHHSEKLESVKGIGKKLRKRIIDGWNEQKSIRHLMVFLQSLGFGAQRAHKIMKLYGDEAIPLIKENPYRLTYDVAGIGFKTADMLGEKLGIPKDSPFRAAASIRYILQQQAEAGHCGMELEALIKTAEGLLQVPDLIVKEALLAEINKESVYQEGIERPIVFLRHFYHAECQIAEHVARLMGKPVWGQFNPDMALSWVQEKIRIQLSQSQQNAIVKALTAKLLIITGGPGVGKTTVVKSILSILLAKRLKVSLCAPTGRAAKRLSETTGLHAKTIHRLLGFDAHSHQFQHNEFDPLDTDLVIVDEASMLDVTLMSSLLSAIPNRAALFLIGDVDQLPSVGPGAVLSDFIKSNKIETVTLTEIFRQQQTSQIVINAHLVNKGLMPTQEQNRNGDFFIIYTKSAEETCAKIGSLVARYIPDRLGFNPMKDIQVLVPMNRNLVGSQFLNQQLQTLLNGNAEPKLLRFEMIYSPNDKVMQIVNNYEKDVFNGDIGYISSVNLENNTLKVDFDGRLIEYTANELDELSLAYAISIHKSQGSEYPVVIIALANQHEIMLVRNLLYTAITRGKKLVILVTQPYALQKALKTLQSGTRVTKLAERIKEMA